MTNKEFFKNMWGDITESLYEKEEEQPVFRNPNNEEPKLSEEAADRAVISGDFAFDELENLLL